VVSTRRQRDWGNGNISLQILGGVYMVKGGVFNCLHQSETRRRKFLTTILQADCDVEQLLGAVIKERAIR